MASASARCAAASARSWRASDKAVATALRARAARGRRWPRWRRAARIPALRPPARWRRRDRSQGVVVAGNAGEDLDAVGSDRQGVFPLRGQRAVLGDDGPAVGQQLGVALAL